MLTHVAATWVGSPCPERVVQWSARAVQIFLVVLFFLDTYFGIETRNLYSSSLNPHTLRRSPVSTRYTACHHILILFCINGLCRTSAKLSDTCPTVVAHFPGSLLSEFYGKSTRGPISQSTIKRLII